MSNPEVDEFLAHYGVKGMKWGVRRKKADTTSSKKERKPFFTPENRKKRALQIAGAAYVAKFLYNIGKDVIPYLVANEANRRQAAAGAKFAAQMLSERGLTNYKTIVL